MSMKNNFCINTIYNNYNNKNFKNLIKRKLNFDFNRKRCFKADATH